MRQGSGTAPDGADGDAGATVARTELTRGALEQGRTKDAGSRYSRGVISRCNGLMLLPSASTS
jgi:hypothetical protein